MTKIPKEFIKENKLAFITPVLQFICFLLAFYNAAFIHKSTVSVVCGVVACICWLTCIGFSIANIKSRLRCYNFYVEKNSKEHTENSSDVVIDSKNRKEKK